MLCIAQVFATPFSSNGTVAGADLHSPVVKSRFFAMKCPVEKQFDQDVEAYLSRYLTYGAKDTEAMLGRAQAYLPIVEHYLVMHGLPDQLKYLPMAESGMAPFAVSTKGAAGLWQLVESTAKHLGLRINDHLDERKDPYKSTEAGVLYLKQLYDRFGSWELALTAYNCGPSRLQRAIKEAGCQDFTLVKQFLPKETQRYLSRYLAAVYVGNYAHLHWLTPKEIPALSGATAGKVYTKLSLRQVSLATGVDLPSLRLLNPAFKKDVLPAYESGVFLVLPLEAWGRYLKRQGA